MSKLIIRALLVVVLLALSIAAPQIHSAAPNLLFVLVVLYAFRERSNVYLGIALFGGLLLDMYAHSAFGTYMVAFLVVGIAIRLATETFFRAEPDSFVYMAVALTVSYVLLIGIAYGYDAIAGYWQLGVQPISPVYISHSAWLSLIYNLIVAAPLYWLVHFIENLLERYNRPHLQSH